MREHIEGTELEDAVVLVFGCACGRRFALLGPGRVLRCSDPRCGCVLYVTQCACGREVEASQVVDGLPLIVLGGLVV